MLRCPQHSLKSAAIGGSDTHVLGPARISRFGCQRHVFHPPVWRSSPPLSRPCSLDGGKASSYSHQGWVGSSIPAEDSSAPSKIPVDPQASEQQQQQNNEQVQGSTQEDDACRDSNGADEEEEGGSRWEDWLGVFEEMDGAAELQQELSRKLQLAVQLEEYGRAAATKKQLEELQARDMVRTVQRELQSALAEERYADAAMLRDQGMARLQGWWAGKAEGDPSGHMLHIGPEFGRWTGRAYTSSDLAEMCGLKESGSPLARLRTRGAISREKEVQSKTPKKGTIGSPAMEVFLKPGPNGTILHQPVSLIGNMPLSPAAVEGLKERPRRPTTSAQEKKETEDKRKQAAKAMSSSLGPIVQLTVSIEADGSANIRAMPTPTPEPRSSLEGRDADEAAAALRELSELSGPPSGSDASPADSEESPSSTEDRERADGKDDNQEGGSEVVEADAIIQEPSYSGGGDAPRQSAEAPSSGESSSSSGSESGGKPNGQQGGNWGLMDVSGLSAKEVENLVARTIDQQNPGKEGKEGSPSSSSPSSSSSTSSSTSSAVGSEGSGESSASGKANSSSSRSSGGSSTAGGDGDEKGMMKGEVVDDDEEEGGPALSRLPAEVEHLGRDAFVLHIPRDGVSTKTAGAERSSAAAGSAATTASGSAASSSPLATFEVLIPVRQFLGGSGDGGSSKSGVEAAGLRGPISEALTRVAAQLTNMRAMQATSSKITPEIMSEALQVVANRLTSGEPTTLRISATGASFTVLDPEVEQGGSRGSVPGSGDQEEDGSEAEIRRQVMEAMGMGNEGQASRSGSKSEGGSQQHLQEASIPIRYTRIPLDTPRTDPFSGLFIGSFGPHGPELLQVQRTMFEGEEAVVATKLTGDPNVPAGSPSFRVKVGRKYKLNARGVYPDELGVIGRYKGEGRVAQRGNVEPRWVDGELLVFAVGASPLTAGAELGFVFVVPGERRFLILLNKIDLAACSENRAL